MKIIDSLGDLYSKYQSKGYKKDTTRNKELTHKADKSQKKEIFAPDEMEFYVKKYEGKSRAGIVFQALAEVTASFGLGLFSKKIRTDVSAAITGEKIVAASQKAQIQKNNILVPFREVKIDQEKLTAEKTLAEHLAIKSEIVQAPKDETELQKEAEIVEGLKALPRSEQELMKEIFASIKFNYNDFIHSEQLGCHTDSYLIIERLDEVGGDVIDITLKIASGKGNLVILGDEYVPRLLKLTDIEFKAAIEDFLKNEVKISPDKIKSTENGFRIKV